MRKVALLIQVMASSTVREARFRSTMTPTFEMTMLSTTGAYKCRMRRTAGWRQSKLSERCTPRKPGSCTSSCTTAATRMETLRLAMPKRLASRTTATMTPKLWAGAPIEG